MKILFEKVIFFYNLKNILYIFFTYIDKLKKKHDFCKFIIYIFCLFVFILELTQLYINKLLYIKKNMFFFFFFKTKIYFKLRYQ
jgi:hypothetical protein